MEYIDGSILQNSFVLGLCLLILASFVAGFIDAIAGGAGLCACAVVHFGWTSTANRARAREISQHSWHTKRDF